MAVRPDAQPHPAALSCCKPYRYDSLSGTREFPHVEQEDDGVALSQTDAESDGADNYSDGMNPWVSAYFVNSAVVCRSSCSISFAL